MAQVNIGAIKFNWKGPYNNSTAYVADDVVSSSGSSYVCILASTGNAVSNGTYWQIMSSAGTNGSNGTDLTSTLSARGDLVFKGASALTRLPKGTSGYFLKQGSNDPEWGAVDLTALSAASLTSGTIPNARYGTPTFSGANLTNLPVSSDFVKINSASFANASSVTIDGSSNSSSAGTYRKHILGLDFEVKGAYTKLQVKGVKSGSIISGSDYSYVAYRVQSNSGESIVRGEGAAYMLVGGDYFRGNSNSNHSLDLNFHNLITGNDSNAYLAMSGLSSHPNQDGDQRLHAERFHGMSHTDSSNNQDRTGLNISVSHSNISGTYTTYGIK